MEQSTQNAEIKKRAKGMTCLHLIGAVIYLVGLIAVFTVLLPQLTKQETFGEALGGVLVAIFVLPVFIIAMLLGAILDTVFGLILLRKTKRGTTFWHTVRTNMCCLILYVPALVCLFLMGSICEGKINLVFYVMFGLSLVLLLTRIVLSFKSKKAIKEWEEGLSETSTDEE
jgi:MFS family permease